MYSLGSTVFSVPLAWCKNVSLYVILNKVATSLQLSEEILTEHNLDPYLFFVIWTLNALVQPPSVCDEFEQLAIHEA